MNGCTCGVFSCQCRTLSSSDCRIARSHYSTCQQLTVVCLFLFPADIISTVEFNYSGELLATGDKGGRVVIFQHEQEVRAIISGSWLSLSMRFVFQKMNMLSDLSHVCNICFQSKNRPHLRGEYNVYSTFQSHEPEFDYLKSLEIEEKINKIRWLPQQNAAHFLLSTNGNPLTFFSRLIILCFSNLKLYD